MGALRGRNLLQRLLETTDNFRQKFVLPNTDTAGRTYPRATPGRSRVQPRAPVTYAGTQAGTSLVPPGLSSPEPVSSRVHTCPSRRYLVLTWRNLAEPGGTGANALTWLDFK